MKRLIALALTGACAALPALAQSPARADTPAEPACWSMIGEVRPVPSSSGTYLLRFGASEGGPFTTTLTLYTASSSYTLYLGSVGLSDGTATAGDAPFVSRPVYFRLPGDERVDAAQLDLRRESTGTACALAYFSKVDFHAQYPADVALLHDFDEEKPATIAATFRSAEAPFNCAVPYGTAALTKGVAPVFPQITSGSRPVKVSVTVAVGLAADGSVRSTSIVRSSDGRFELSALHAALAGAFRAAIFRCTPVAGTYLMQIEYDYPN